MNILKPGGYRLVWCAPLEIEAKAMLERRQSKVISGGRGNDHVFKLVVSGSSTLLSQLFPPDKYMKLA
jgi:hypothetical protein